MSTREEATGAGPVSAANEPAVPPDAPAGSTGSPSLVRIGMVVWLASELMFFSGLFAAYYFLRGADTEWPPEGVELGTARAAMFTALLVASSATVHLAGHRAEAGDERGTRRWTLLTIVLGAAFLVNQGLEYAALEFTATDHAYGSLFYLMTGFHGAHVLGGIVGIAVVLARGMRGQFSTEHHVAVEAVHYYWHFVDVVWVFLFLTIYVLR